MRPAHPAVNSGLSSMLPPTASLLPRNNCPVHAHPTQVGSRSRHLTQRLPARQHQHRETVTDTKGGMWLEQEMPCLEHISHKGDIVEAYGCWGGGGGEPKVSLKR
jgi:hypothetical protein